MTIRTDDYAQLSNNCYKNLKQGDRVPLDGVMYKVIATANDPSGYQATAYQRIDTKEVIIANRGTEFGREPLKDGLQTDGGMVIKGVNDQLDDAMVFGNRVRANVREMEKDLGRTIPITVTGHSLGGTLAEIQAARFGFQGVTFNAYGAAGLGYDIPEGGHQVINFVRATDMVSAASAHFGETHIVAAPDDLDALRRGGYLDPANANAIPNPFIAASISAHKMGNFLPDNPIVGQSLLLPLSEARYRAYHDAIDHFRHDVMEDRKVLSGEWALKGEHDPAQIEARKALMMAQAKQAATLAALELSSKAMRAVDTGRDYTAYQLLHAVHQVHASMDKVSNAIGQEVADHIALPIARNLVDASTHVQQFASQRVVQGAQAATELVHAGKQTLARGVDAAHAIADKAPQAALHLNHPNHPDHAMYLQAREGVHQLDAQQHRTPDQRSDQLAASLVVAARRDDLSRIDHVSLHRDAQHVSAWQIASPQSPWHEQQLGQKDTTVPTVQALNTAIEQSSHEWVQAMQQKQVASEPSSVQEQQPTQTTQQAQGRGR